MGDFILWALIALNVVTVGACIWVYFLRGDEYDKDFEIDDYEDFL